MDENDENVFRVLGRIAEYLKREQQGATEDELPPLPEEIVQALKLAGPAALKQALAALQTAQPPETRTDETQR